MSRYLYFRIRFFSFFTNQDGLKKFADKTINWLIEVTTKNLRSLRKSNSKLLVEKDNLRVIAEEMGNYPMLDYDKFFTIKKKINNTSFIIISIILAELFLNYISTLIFINGEGVLFVLLRWFLSIVLTFGGVIISEKLIESIFPLEEDKKEDIKPKPIPIIILWSILLLGIEITIIGVSGARARDIEGGNTKGILYFGFIILSMILPVIAGAARWDLMHYFDAYKNTQQLHHIEKRIKKIDSKLHQNEEEEILFYKIKSTIDWDIFNEFKTYKENFNKRKGIAEDISNHFARDNSSFQKEADKRYEIDIRELTARSLRKLELTDKSVGKKIGQK